MKANFNASFECESAETHSTNAVLSQGLKVIQNHVCAKYNLRNCEGNRQMATNFVRGLVENKDVITSLVSLVSPKAASVLRPVLVLVEKVSKGEKMTPETEEPEMSGDIEETKNETTDAQ